MIAETLIPTASETAFVNSVAAIESSPADISGALVATSVPRSALAHLSKAFRTEDAPLQSTTVRSYTNSFEGAPANGAPRWDAPPVDGEHRCCDARRMMFASAPCKAAWMLHDGIPVWYCNNA